MAIRVGVAVLLASALFAGLAVVGAAVPRPQAKTPVITADMFRRQGNTIGLGRIIRFRVLAASDSAFDQAVKLKVRDAVLAYLRPELQGAGSETTADTLISGRLPEIRQVALQTLRSNGSDQPVQVSCGVTAFPVKTYGSYIFPAGNYDALKIVIGPGQGHNWWCVLFPPLCYVDLAESAQNLSGGEQIYPVVAGCSPGTSGQTGLHPVLSSRIGLWLSELVGSEHLAVKL
jgi:stage II sporulation protein R